MIEFVLPSILSIPAFTPLSYFLIGIGGAFVLGFTMTYLFRYVKKNQEVRDNYNHQIVGVKKETIGSPLQGKVVSLSEIGDPLFATETVGKGIAIKPEIGKVISPVNGVITTLFPTGHAIGITTDGGAEMLIFIGVDTIKLNGEYFTTYVSQGDQVKEGDLLIEFDIEKIQAAGYETITPIVITNTEEYLDIKTTESTSVKSNDSHLKVTA